MAAFDLFEATEGPVLVDYPEDVPANELEREEDAMMGMVCPIDLPKLPDPTAPTNAMGQALMQEIKSLAPWYDLAVRTRGLTTVGPSGLSIEDAAKFLIAFLADQTVAPPREDLPEGRVLKLAYEDIKAYYGEAITAQPGGYTSEWVENWLFNETVFGQALWTLRDICRASDDEAYHYLGRNSIVPDRQINPPESAARMAGYGYTSRQ
jgi:D-proline reductase (dithiol) PrdB